VHDIYIYGVTEINRK